MRSQVNQKIRCEDNMADNPITGNYDLGNGNSPILLSVFIGFRQTSIMVDSQDNEIFGSAAVYIDNHLVRPIGVVNNKFLGYANDLRGKTISVLTTVLDINPQTNDTKVDYVFSGGSSVQTFTSKDRVAEDWGAKVHKAEIMLG